MNRLSTALSELRLQVSDDAKSALKRGEKVDLAKEPSVDPKRVAELLRQSNVSAADFYESSKCSGISLKCWNRKKYGYTQQCCLYLSFPTILCVQCNL